MLARLRKRDENDEGFTLIELLVVIIIIGILAAIAIPTFLNQRKKGWDAASKAELKSIATAQESYATDANGTYLAVADATTAAKEGEKTLKAEGYNISEPFRISPGTFKVDASGTTYCAQLSHKSQPTVVWSLSNTGPKAGEPVLGACPAATTTP